MHKGPRAFCASLWLLFLRLGVSLIVLRTQVFERYMRIFLRGCEAGVSQEFLDRPQIRSAFQQMGGEGMAQSVRREMATGRQAQASFFHQPLDIPRVQASTPNTDEHGHLAIVFGVGKGEPIAFCQVSAQSPCGELPERDDALFAPFSKDPDELLRQVEILIV